ncbi:MAG TPA: hypothetical protein VMG09_13600 [Bacteroidota bacterium]|nr:hypothetical protein [Bacteroidota bacterium]
MEKETAPIAETNGAGADAAKEMQEMKISIRQLAHDMSNPLGTLRMAVYYLETAKPEESKRGEYYAMMGKNIDRIEGLIRSLRIMAGSPSVEKDQNDGSL